MSETLATSVQISRFYQKNPKSTSAKRVNVKPKTRFTVTRF